MSQGSSNVSQKQIFFIKNYKLLSARRCDHYGPISEMELELLKKIYCFSITFDHWLVINYAFSRL